MRVLLYTDNPFFSGAENMIATFFSEANLREEFDLALVHRASLKFERGAGQRLPADAPRYPVELLDVPSRTDALPALLRPLAKGAAYLTGAKYRYVRENARRLTPVFERLAPDVLHVNSGGYPGAYSTLSAVLAAREAGICRVVYVANNIAMPYTWRRRLDRPLDARVVRAVDTFVTGSSFAGDALTETLGIERSKVHTIPNGIRPRPIVEAPETVRMRMGAPAGRPVVAVVANLEARKGHVHLLRALELLKGSRQTPLPWVAIEGEGPEEAHLREHVVARGLTGDVGFLGREERVFDLMNAADVVALPSIANEDFPNVVLEAMALGRPVVASRIAGTPEQIVDGATGLLVPPGDAQALAGALATLAADPELRERFGTSGRARFGECFTAQRAVEAYRKLWLGL